MKSFAFLFIALLSTTSMALTLKEQKKMKEAKDYVAGDDSYKDETVKKCGYDIPLTIEAKMVTPFMEGNYSLPSYCDSPRGTISGMCEDETSKTAIKKAIKKIDCKLGKEGEVAFKLNGGTLTFTVGVNSSNLEQKTKEWLENNLK